MPDLNPKPLRSALNKPGTYRTVLCSWALRQRQLRPNAVVKHAF